MRRDDALPIIVAIATAPIVLPNGKLMAPDGFHRESGTAFIIPDELRAVIPTREDCTPQAVAEAINFLCDDWLCDVSADFAGKCILIAAALTIIERTLLSDRPVFFVTAGRRGGGKTTTLTMLIMAVTGLRPAASAWATNEDERRKALLSYLMAGVPYILWDNIKRGTQISCPHIEKACTSATYADRKLGVSEMVTAAASSIHLFTGNNIGPRSDFASRSLKVALSVDRADPENREFIHPDPVGWTEANRAEILQALYTILLGNPQLKTPLAEPSRTRFKMWWRLVGSAIEHAVKLASWRSEEGGEQFVLDFQKLFLDQESENEESTSLADALDLMLRKFDKSFRAAQVSAFINDAQNDVALREFLYPSAQPTQTVSPKSVGKQLKKHVGNPVRHNERTLTLMKDKDAHDLMQTFWIKVDEEASNQ
jgi:hypothetical protein